MIERIPIETVVYWIEEFRQEKPSETISVPIYLRHIILAMVSKESTFNPRGPRFEKDYQWIYNADVFATKHGVSRETEIAMQSFSYGLMQIMGANCRVMGFGGFLFDLSVDHQKAFNYGVRFFLHQVDRYNGSIEKAICAYNCGYAKFSDGKLNGQDYVDDILYRAEKFKHTTYGVT